MKLSLNTRVIPFDIKQRFFKTGTNQDVVVEWFLLFKAVE